MKVNTREVALSIIKRVHQEGAFANLVLDAQIKRYNIQESRDKNFITELAYGTIRAKGTLNWLIAKASNKPLNMLDADVLDILRMGAFQILFMSGVKEHAAVYETVELAPQKARGFVNAVLRALLPMRASIPWPKGDTSASLALRYHYPEWIVKMWLDRFGIEATKELLAAQNQPLPQVYRINTIKTDIKAVLDDWAGHDLPVTTCRYDRDAVYVSGNRSIREPVIQDSIAKGLVQPQGEAAILAVEMLEPQPGEVIVDTCAAPGTKSTHIASMMGNRGRVIAIEINQARAGLIEESCRRLGASIVEVIHGDARELAGLIGCEADRIIVDAPCSGLGNLDKRPDARWKKSPDDVDRLAGLGREILTGATGALKPGGTLVFSTCTITTAENEDNIKWFLNANPDFYEVTQTELAIEDARSSPGYQFLPSIHETEGFYMVKLAKAK